ncbi:hypothetical protein EV361DRAFT_80806 [Lentinula raphanica]|nr:hypothetical protein EV361DRAFT_80806 [Lentinula raphanica]
MLSAAIDSEAIQKCSHCTYRGPIKSFPQKKNLGYLKKCYTCRARDQATAKTRRNGDASKDKESPQSPSESPSIDSSVRKHITWSELMEMVDQTGKEDVDLEYTVDLQQLCSNLEGDIKEQDEVCESQEDDEQNGTHTAENFKLDVGVIARQISRDIWDKTEFRFMWVVYSRTCMYTHMF